MAINIAKATIRTLAKKSGVKVDTLKRIIPEKVKNNRRCYSKAFFYLARC